MVLSAAFSVAAMGPTYAADAPKVSKAAAKPLKAAQDAIAAKKYADAEAKLKEVAALPNKNAYDTHVMNELLGSMYARQGNYAEAAKALEAGLNDGFLDAADTQQRIKALAQVNYQIKNYDKAIEFGNKSIKAGNNSEDMRTLVAQSYYIKGDYKGAAAFMKQDIENEIKSGQKPKEQSLQLLQSSCVKLNDDACVSQQFERLVTYYPKPEYWQNLVLTLLNSSGGSDRSLLQVFRLADEVNVLNKPSDYTEMAQLAIEAGSPGEAQRVLEKGLQKNVFTEARDKDKNTRLLNSAKQQASLDQSSLAKTEAEADKATTGEKDVGVGLAYLSYQQYDKAAAAIQRGIQKGGLKNPADANLLLGIAQLKAGKKDDAIKTFKDVKGDDKLERLANLWTIHARQA